MSISTPSTASNAIPPGWYGDPSSPGQARWWSGQDWTYHVQALPSAALGAGASPWTIAATSALPRQRSLAIRSLVWGLVAVVIDPFLAPSVLAIVFGVMALRGARRLELHGQPAPGRRRAIVGIVAGVVGGAFTIFCTVVFWLRLTGRA